MKITNEKIPLNYFQLSRSVSRSNLLTIVQVWHTPGKTRFTVGRDPSNNNDNGMEPVGLIICQNLPSTVGIN